MFNVREISRFLSQKEHLYVFNRQNTTWRFSGGDSDVTLGGQTYTGAAIKNKGLRQSSEPAKNTFTVVLPRTLDITNIWRPYPPTDPIHVTYLQHHVGDPDNEVVTKWMGWVGQPKYTDTELELVCTGDPGKYRGVRKCVMRGCDHIVYGVDCKLDRAQYQFAATLTAASGRTISANAFTTAAFPLAGGWIEYTSAAGFVERRDIKSATGNTVTLNLPSADLAVGTNIIAVPGCARTYEACTARSNTINYGGFIYMPNGTKNAFEGNPL